MVLLLLLLQPKPALSAALSASFSAAANAAAAAVALLTDDNVLAGGLVAEFGFSHAPHHLRPAPPAVRACEF